MPRTAESALKRQNEELLLENRQLKEEIKRLKQDNQCYEAQKAMEQIQEPRFVRLDELVRNPGLQHIALKIFRNLGMRSLENCRMVSKEWRNCIDSDRHYWLRKVKKLGKRLIGKTEAIEESHILEGHEEEEYGYEDLAKADKANCKFIKCFITKALDYIYKNESLKNLKTLVPFMKNYREYLEDNSMCMANYFDPWYPWMNPLEYALDEKYLDVYELFAKSPMRDKKKHVGIWNDLEQQYRTIQNENDNEDKRDPEIITID